MLTQVPLDRVRAVIEERWPELRPQRLVAIDSGWDSFVVEIDSRWIFRWPRRADVVRRLAKEVALLPCLADVVTVALPHFEFVCLDEPACAGYRKIAGEPPARADGRIAEQAARFLSELHGLHPRAVPLDGDARSWREEHERFYADVCTRVLPLLDDGDRARAKRMFESYLLDDSNFDFEPVVVHADLGPDHILVGKDGRLSGVIDWSDAAIGDPAIDLGWLLFGLGRDFGQRLLTRYGGVRDTGIAKRALFYHRAGPWHEVVHGLDSGQPAFVTSGIAGIRARLP